MNISQWIKNNFKDDDLALVTGASSGIGLEYSKILASLGCNLLCLSEDSSGLAKLKNELESEFLVSVTTVCLDLRSTTETRKVAVELAKKKIKILINNAGFGMKGKFESNNLDEYIDVIAVNATSPIIFTHNILPNMLAQNTGLIITVASINALIPIPFNQVYTATKAFLLNCFLAIAHENRKSKIVFQLVLPGTTKTPFHDRQGADPQKLVMLPEDVVSASFACIGSLLCIPNPADKILAKVVPLLPIRMAMSVSEYLLKKRLGV